MLLVVTCGHEGEAWRHHTWKVDCPRSGLNSNSNSDKSAPLGQSLTLQVNPPSTWRVHSSPHTAGQHMKGKDTAV